MTKGQTYYAQTTIEVPGPGAQPVLRPGDEVPADLPGLDELIEGGAVADTEPVRDVHAGDGAAVGEESA